jgi:hypothetical protein
MLKRTIARCRLKSRLGAGRDSVLYLAEHKRLRIPVVVEVFPHDRPGYDEGWVRNVLRQLSAGSRLRHPNIVTVIEAGCLDDCDYAVTEWLDVDSLRRRLTLKGTVSQQEALRLAEGILEALEAAAEKGGRHGSISPETILIDYDGRPRLRDFGRPLRRQDLYEFTITGEGRLAGQCHYVAPERIDDLPGGDARSDLFSLGATLYEMLCGRRAFSGATAQEVLDAVRQGAHAPPAEAAPGLPAALAELTERLLASDPEGRPAGPSAALAEVRRVGVQVGAGRRAAPRPLSLPMTGRLARKGPWIVAGVLLILLSVMGLGRLLSDCRRERVEAPRPLDLASPARVAVLTGPALGAGAQPLAAPVRESLLALCAAQIACVGGLTTAGPFLSEDLSEAGPVQGQAQLQGLPDLRLTITHAPGLGRIKWHMAFMCAGVGRGWIVTQEAAALEGEDPIPAIGPALKALLAQGVQRVFVPGTVVPQDWPPDAVWADGPLWAALGPALAAEYDGRWQDARDALARARGGAPPDALEAFYAWAADWEKDPAAPLPEVSDTRFPGEFQALAEALARLRKGGEADEKALAAYLRACPYSPRARFLLGVLRTRQKGVPEGEARGAFWQALRADSSYLPAARALLRMAAAAGPQEADEVMRRCKELPHTERRWKLLEDYRGRLGPAGGEKAH